MFWNFEKKARFQKCALTLKKVCLLNTFLCCVFLSFRANHWDIWRLQLKWLAARNLSREVACSSTSSAVIFA